MEYKNSVLIYKYILMYWFLLEIGSPLIMMNSVTLFISRVGLLFISFFIIIKKEIKIERKKILLAIVFVCLMGLSELVSLRCDNYATMVMRILLLCTGVMYSCIFTIDEFRYIFVNTMIFISVVSLVFFLIQLVNPKLVYDLAWKRIAYDKSAVYVANPFYSCIQNKVLSESTGSVYIDSRNSGIFFEPGVYSVFILIALLMAISSEKMYGKWTILLFIISELTGTSVIGICLLVCILLYNSRKYIKYYMIGILPGIVSVYIDYKLRYESITRRFLWYIGKSDKEIGVFDELSYRTGFSFVNPHMLIKSLLFGQGLSGETTYNSFINIYFCYGLFFLAIYGFCIYRFLRKLSSTGGEALFFFLILSLSLFIEGIWYNIFFWVMIFLGDDKRIIMGSNNEQK